MRLETKTDIWNNPQIREKFLKINRSILIAWGFISLIAAYVRNYEILIIFWVIMLIYQITMENSYNKWKNKKVEK